MTPDGHGPRAVLMPATPLVLSGIDHGEPAALTRLRERLHGTLRAEYDRTGRPLVLHVTGPVPEVVGLGGLGIDRGLRVAVSGTVPADVVALDSQDYRTALEEIRAESLDIPTVVALMATHEAGVPVHLAASTDRTPPLSGTVPSSGTALVPLDLSAVAHPDGPLAPVEGAAETNTALVNALLGGAREDRALVERILEIGVPGAALGHLTALLDSPDWRLSAGGEGASAAWRTELVDRTDVHHVDYLLAVLTRVGR
ncbi:hypothetical protein [Brevibacterium litoralis]|uniref:hypothetical protein n=1 Tax=Brevibacterium litoralis TaxID=3138935 RepID=UPI0032EE8451